MDSKKLILLLTFTLLGIGVGYSQNTWNPNVKAHSKIQKERSYEQWKKNQPKVRIKAVKAAIQQSKNTKGNRTKNSKLLSREANLRKRIKI